MMSPCKNLVMLLVILIVSPLLHSHLFIHAASTSLPITRPRIIFLTGLGLDDEYTDDSFEDHSPPPKVLSSARIPVVHQEPQICQYKPCLENQVPCAQLSAETGCLCPGLSGAEVPPHAPIIQALLPISEGDNMGKVEVQWCAPSSVVTSYRVVVEGSSSDALEFGDALRRGMVGSLEAGTKVCVEAVNSAGRSTPSEFSCQRYDPPKTSSNLLAWIIGGGVVLLLLVCTTAVILWKYKLCQRGKRDSADGLGNPSYSTEGTL